MKILVLILSLTGCTTAPPVSDYYVKYPIDTSHKPLVEKFLFEHTR